MRTPLLVALILLASIGIVVIGGDAFEGWKEYQDDKHIWEMCHFPTQRARFTDRVDVINKQAILPPFLSAEEICQGASAPQFRLRVDRLPYTDEFVDMDPYF